MSYPTNYTNGGGAGLNSKKYSENWEFFTLIFSNDISVGFSDISGVNKWKRKAQYKENRYFPIISFINISQEKTKISQDRVVNM